MQNTLTFVEAAPALTELVYQRLRDAIMDGALAPGQRLLQSELAEMLGVSRAPVSHVLHLLRHQGLVRESGRRGVEIAPVDPDGLRNIYQLRSALDALAARLLANRFATGAAGVDARSRLETVLAEGLALDPAVPLTERVRKDLAFHKEILSLCGNPSISEALAPVWPHVGRAMNAVLAADELRTRAWLEHQTIVAFILEGNAVEAARAAHDHASRAGEEAVQRLRGDDS